MSTTKFDLTYPNWTDCGVTPAFIQSTSSQAVQFVVATSAPSNAPDTAAHVLYPQGEMSANIGFTSKVFARPSGGSATLVVSRPD